MKTPNLHKLPFLQHDVAWANKRLWNRAVVQRIAVEDAGYSAPAADDLLRGGTTIRQQGCQLCSIAMVLHLLDGTDPARARAWTPLTVREDAQEYFNRAGFSLAPPYSDLCADLTQGRVQLLFKEDHAARREGRRLDEIDLVRAYRAVRREQREGLVVMLRIGTDDQTVASHYLLIDPADDGPADAADVSVLDPDAPTAHPSGGWTLMRSWERFASDPDRRTILDREGVRPGDVAAVYLFAKWSAAPGFGALVGLLGSAAMRGRPRT